MNSLTSEIQLDLTDDVEGVGTLIVTDLSALIDATGRPVPGFDYLMDLGDTSGQGDEPPHWHIVSQLPAARTHALLDRALSRYFNGYCQGKVWIDVEMQYCGPNGIVIPAIGPGYGFSDGSIRGIVTVYPAEFWEGMPSVPGLVQADWSPFMRDYFLLDAPTALTQDGVEDFLARGARTRFLPLRTLVLARPSDDPLGFRARAFRLATSG